MVCIRANTVLQTATFSTQRAKTEPIPIVSHPRRRPPPGCYNQALDAAARNCTKQSTAPDPTSPPAPSDSHADTPLQPSPFATAVPQKYCQTRGLDGAKLAVTSVFWLPMPEPIGPATSNNIFSADMRVQCT
jgi:hypothetical protein